MFKQLKFPPFVLAGFALFWLVLPLTAQTTASGPDGQGLYSADMIKVYFFLLLVAAIINRIVQYIKLLLRWILPRAAFMQRLYDWYWQLMKQRLIKNRISFDEQTIRPVLRKFMISIVTYTMGIALGIFICLQLDIGAVKYMGIAVPGKTLDAVISGIAAGIGIEPVHSLFRLAEEKRRLKKLFKDVIAGEG